MAEKRTTIVKSIDKAWRRVNELASTSNSKIYYSVFQQMKEIAQDVSDISKMYSVRWESLLWTDNHLQEMLDRAHTRLDELEKKCLKGEKNETEGS